MKINVATSSNNKMFHIARKTCIVRASACNRDVKGIFQLHSHVPVSIKQAREAYEIIKDTHVNITPTMDDYAIHGVDGEMVEKYLLTVEYIQRCYERAKIQPLYNDVIPNI